MSGTLTIEAARGVVAAATGSLAGLGECMFAVGNAELGPFFRQVDDLSRQVEAARVAILGEALGRGVVAESDCPTAAGWVIQWAPSFRAGGAAQLVQVTQATRAVRNLGLAAAVLGARVGVRNAAVALSEMDKLRPRLREEAVEAVWAGFLAIATEHGPAQIRALRDQLIAIYGDEDEFQRHQDKLKAGVCLGQPCDDDGMAVYRLRLDPEGKGADNDTRRCSGRCPPPNPPRTARTCAPRTSAAVRPWWRSAGAPPRREARLRPRPRPRSMSRSTSRLCGAGAGPGPR